MYKDCLLATDFLDLSHITFSHRLHCEFEAIMFSVVAILLTVAPHVLGCALHNNHIAPVHKRQVFNITNTGREPTDWSYEASYDWGRLSPEYSLCQTGTQQAPIALNLNQGLSQQHIPLFTGYGENYTGEYYNWGYGYLNTGS